MPVVSTQEGAHPQSIETGLARMVDLLLSTPKGVLLFGPSGSGKSTLAAAIASRVGGAGRPCSFLSADVGAPSFGVPAAVNLGLWDGHRWRLEAYEAVCSLNAARFRLPLVAAVRRLLQRAPSGAMIIEAPGLVRGVAAAELLLALCEATSPARLVVLVDDKAPAPLPEECLSLPQEVLYLRASPVARPPGRHEHRDHRTRLWNGFLEHSEEHVIQREGMTLLGTPPPLDRPTLWKGAIAGLSDNKSTLVMGEVVALEGQTLRLRCPPFSGVPTQLIIRDAVRDNHQYVVTRRPARDQYPPSPGLVYPSSLKHAVSGPVVKTREVMAELANGVYEDPLLLVSLRQSRRCLLFDLGDTGRIPLRLLHRVSDVFVTHAHIDHIGGFMGLLRARLGAPALCRLYGPPGMVRHICGYLSGVLWDRIGEDGPCFEVSEIHGDRQYRYRLRAGQEEPEFLETLGVTDGVILRERGFVVRAVGLDHRTPVLAYAFEPIARLKISETGFKKHGWQPGPWLAELKQAEREGAADRPIRMPDGQILLAGDLSEQLMDVQPGDKLVYATDLADTAENRQRLVNFARGTHSLFCESCFALEDRDRAERHGHLTTRACGEIAAEAGVQHLIPFHFSRRYEADPERLYREIEAVFSGVIRFGRKSERD